MAIDSAIQIFLVVIFAILTGLCKKSNLDWGVKFFGWGTAILFIAFAIIGVLDAVNLIK